LITNSIIAGNFFSQARPPANGADVFGAVTSGGFNLIGVREGALSNWHADDLLGNAAAPLDPSLDLNGPADNGGSTWTIKLRPESLAYQRGKPGLAGETDQRRYTRRDDASHHVTIGAYDPDALAP
jgi:hypothetical protein